MARSVCGEEFLFDEPRMKPGSIARAAVVFILATTEKEDVKICRECLPHLEEARVPSITLGRLEE